LAGAETDADEIRRGPEERRPFGNPREEHRGDPPDEGKRERAYVAHAVLHVLQMRKRLKST
jgi:hypothetical protein